MERGRSLWSTSHKSWAKTITESINQIIDNYGFILVGINNNAVIYLNWTATPTMQNLYHDLQSQQRQMIVYTGAVNLESKVEYNNIQAIT